MKRSLFAGIAGLLATAAPAHAQSGAPAGGIALTVEGGLACSNHNDSVVAAPGAKLGERGCGGTGAVELSATGKPIFSIFDHWAVRGRFTSFDDSQMGIAFGGHVINATHEDKRAVIDAEIGTKLPFGMFGSTSRLTLGLRYATYTGTRVDQFLAGPAAGDVDKTQFEWSGFGPRIGLRSTLPLGSHWMIESRSGVAALFGDHTFRYSDNGAAPAVSGNSGTVISLETSTALAYKLNGSDAGPIVSVGLLSEYWFKQIDARAVATSLDRHSWGPFARVRMPLQ